MSLWHIAIAWLVPTDVPTLLTFGCDAVCAVTWPATSATAWRASSACTAAPATTASSTACGTGTIPRCRRDWGHVSGLWFVPGASRKSLVLVQNAHALQLYIQKKCALAFQCTLL